MNNRRNSKKEAFLRKFPPVALEDENCNIAKRCKFNFSYFDARQKVGADFTTWDEANLQLFVSKLIEYTREPLSYWNRMPIGSRRGHVLEIYGAFPKRSEFEHPAHVPSDVDWARFRLDQKKRLVGFTIPEPVCHRDSSFDVNTFYVVFLDLDHRFYPPIKR